MPITRKRPSLSAEGRDFLTSEFEAIATSSRSSLQRRADQIAVTYRPRRQGRDAIPDRPIPIDDFHLLAASYRWCDYTNRRPRWRVNLASYRAALDFPGTGRIAFRCERSWDATCPRTLTQPRPNTTAIRAAVVLHHAIQDAEPRYLATSLKLPDFFYGFDPRRPPRFDHLDLADVLAAQRDIDGFRAWPAQLFWRDGRSTLDRPPSRVFASLAHLKGRTIRNPAYAVLRRRGLLPAAIGHKAWLSTLSTATDGGRVFQNPGAEGTETAAIRRRIEDHVLADATREPLLLDTAAEACHAMGIKLAEGPDGIDALAELVDNPWSPAPVPYAAVVQVLRLAGPAGPDTMSFADAAVDVDLFDLGPGRDRFTPASPEGARS